MAINFNAQIKFNPEEIKDDLQRWGYEPDTCPICHTAILPHYILEYEKDINQYDVLCGCPRNECGSIFFVEYGVDNFLREIEFLRCYPYTKERKKFYPEIEDLSPDFINIYNQSYVAEQESLDLICGVGYRKSLEFLIKDYSKANYPDDTEKIERLTLNQCIQNYITMPTIKGMAERAVWLGNDETHYKRKWANRDLNDLKNLIDLTVHYIVMDVKAKKYMDEMQR